MPTQPKRQPSHRLTIIRKIGNNHAALTHGIGSEEVGPWSSVRGEEGHDGSDSYRSVSGETS